MRLTALAPAAMLTCPPGSTISCLSFEPTRSISGAEQAGGTMWSYCATMCRKGTVMRPRSTGRPRRRSVPLYSALFCISSFVVWRK